MSRVIYLILFCSFLFLSCSTKEEKISRDVEKVYKKITKNIWGPEKVVGSGHQSGNVSGSARISVQSEYISVTYSALGYSHRADGKLTEFDIVKKCGYENCKDYIGYSLQASWNPENDASGRLNITVSKKNIVEIYIFGDGNWKHWIQIDMKGDMTVQNLLRETYKSIYQEEEDFNFENNDFKKEALIVETGYMKWLKDNENSFFKDSIFRSLDVLEYQVLSEEENDNLTKEQFFFKDKDEEHLQILSDLEYYIEDLGISEFNKIIENHEIDYDAIREFIYLKIDKKRAKELKEQCENRSIELEIEYEKIEPEEKKRQEALEIKRLVDEIPEMDSEGDKKQYNSPKNIYRVTSFSTKQNLTGNSGVFDEMTEKWTKLFSFKDGYVEGEYFEFYSNGQIKMQGQFSAGLQTGNWQYFYENGQFSLERKFENGIIKDGAYDFLTNTGALGGRETYKNGNLITIGSYYEGGYVFALDDNGGGWIVANKDFGSADYQSAIEICENKHLNGFNDWYLPSSKQLEVIQKTVGFGASGVSKNIANFTYDSYWSSTYVTGKDLEAWQVTFYDSGRIYIGVNKKKWSNRVRAIRKFE